MSMVNIGLVRPVNWKAVEIHLTVALQPDTRLFQDCYSSTEVDVKHLLNDT